MIKIEAGKSYQTRDGRKAGPMSVSDDVPKWPFKAQIGNDDAAYYLTDGSCPYMPRFDLVSEWVEPETLKRKFKVGDKVRRTLAGNPYAPVGFEAILLAGRGEELNYQGNDGDIFLLYEDHWELIEPAHQGPVRTVTTTRKEINAGFYDKILYVGEQYSREIPVVITRFGKPEVAMPHLNPAEMRTVAKHLVAMADAMESGE